MSQPPDCRQTPKIGVLFAVFLFHTNYINYSGSDSNDEKTIDECRNQFAMLTIDDFVSKYHFVRKIDAAIQFDFISNCRQSLNDCLLFIVYELANRTHQFFDWFFDRK